MILGTVQLGLDYGVNNRSGKPSLEKAYEILDIAYENGIRTLDTGPMYGNSEEIVGSYLKATGRSFLINTKLPDMIPEENDLTYGFIEKTIKSSLDKLGIKQIHCYYLHQYHQCKNYKFMDMLAQFRKREQIEKIGVSIYHPQEMLYICENLKEVVDVIQIPYNIFSIFHWEEALEQAMEAEILVYARSLFLQGLAFLSPDNAFSSSIGAGKYISYVRELAKRRDQEIEQTCYDAVIEELALTDIILGVETKEQLFSNLKLEKNHKSFSEEEKKSVSEYMKDIPLDILDPTTWNKYRGETQ